MAKVPWLVFRWFCRTVLVIHESHDVLAGHGEGPAGVAQSGLLVLVHGAQAGDLFACMGPDRGRRA
jgi:hypothetical protein